MYIKIIDDQMSEYIFRSIKKLKFRPETDVSGNVIPIGGFSVMACAYSTLQSEFFKIGYEIILYDEDDNVYAWFLISDVKKESVEWYTIEAQSCMGALDKLELEPLLYPTGGSFYLAVENIFHKLHWYSGNYYMDPVFINQSQNYQVRGYFPKQTARQRLQQMCYTVGAYIKQFFCEKISFLPVPTSAVLIPDNKIFWRPQVNYDDFVTSVKVIAYTYTAGEPGSGDEYVVDQHGDTYIVTKQETVVTNPDTPTWILDNEVEFDQKCVTQGNVSDVVSRLSTFLFSRKRVTADILNNGEYLPGNKYMFATGSGGMASGWMESADFVFGHGKKSKIEIGSADDVESALLRIECVDSDEELLHTFEYNLPVGYQYSIQNLWLDIMRNSHRYIYYPDQVSATGTITTGDNVDDELYHIALDWYKKRLKIERVDSVSESDGVVSIV